LQMLSLCKLCLDLPSVQTLFCGQVAEIRRLQEPAWQKPSRTRWWKIYSYEKRQIRRHACIPLSIQISRCHRKEVFKAKVECAATTRSAMPLTAIAQPNVFGRISDSCKNQFHRNSRVSFLSATSMASISARPRGDQNWPRRFNRSWNWPQADSIEPEPIGALRAAKSA